MLFFEAAQTQSALPVALQEEKYNRHLLNGSNDKK